MSIKVQYVADDERVRLFGVVWTRAREENGAIVLQRESGEIRVMSGTEVERVDELLELIKETFLDTPAGPPED